MDAWDRFAAGEATDHLPVRELVLSSWARCRTASVPLSASAAPRIDRDLNEMVRRRNRDLLKASTPILGEATTLLRGTNALMLVTDADGIALDVAGDKLAVHAGEDIALSAGGKWTERHAGTNGIGTALATGIPVFVHAAEHYCKGIKEWSCAAAPIHDPLNGAIAGILNISTQEQASRAQIFALAVLAARDRKSVV